MFVPSITINTITMKNKSTRQFWNSGVNPILGYRYESLGQQARSKQSFYSQHEKETALCTK
jgi:hypothetical protein